MRLTSIALSMFQAFVVTGTPPGVSTPRWNERPAADVEVLWPKYRPVLLAFQEHGDRPALLAALKALRQAHPASSYDAELRGLIEPLEREAAQARLRLPFLDVRASQRTPEQAARYWIFMLRELGGEQGSGPGYPAAGDGVRTPADELVSMGPAAIPYLLKALDDDTPTRTLAWQRDLPVCFVLRRQDVAMQCLERIAGRRFYESGATFVHLYMDTPERRRSAIDKARKWWAQSRGQSQAQGL